MPTKTGEQILESLHQMPRLGLADVGPFVLFAPSNLLIDRQLENKRFFRRRHLKSHARARWQERPAADRAPP
jgi:hypothetical protein